MAGQRTVTGVLKHPDGSAWDSAEIRITPLVSTFTLSPDATYPIETKTITTLSDGSFTTTLASGTSTSYLVTMPEGESFPIIVPDGGITTLELLRAATSGVPAMPTVSGDVYGPSSVSDNEIPRFDGPTGKLLQGSGVIIDDFDNIFTNWLTTNGFDIITGSGIYWSLYGDIVSGNDLGFYNYVTGKVGFWITPLDVPHLYALVMHDPTDPTKTATFILSGFPTTTNRNFTLPNASGTFLLDTAVQNVSGKTFTDAIKSTSPTGGVGYATGAGVAATAQATSKATTVTANGMCGTLTLNAASLAAGTIVSFTWNNSAIAATDVIAIQHDSVGTIGAYTVTARPTGAGTAQVTIRNNTAGALAEAIVLRFAIIKAVTS